MRFHSLLFLSAFAAFAAAQDTSVHVTYKSRAQSTAHILAELRNQTHVDLEPAAVMKGDVLVVSVEDLPLKDLMDRIAIATSGSWKQEGSAYRLVANNSIRRQEDRKEEALRRAATAKAIAERVADMNGQSGTKDSKAAGNAPKQVPPTEAIITKLLMSADSSLIADLGPGERLVFSSEPTRMQHGFSASPTEAINQFIEQHNSSIPENQDATNTQLAGMTADQANAIRNLTKSQTTRIGQVSKALLIITRMGLGIISLTQLELRLYDASGAVAFTTRSMLNMKDDNLSALVATMQGKKPEPTTGKKTPIEYSDDSKAMMGLSAGMMTGNFKLNLPPALRAKLYNPSRFDPLSYSVSDEILTFAKTKGKPVVANVPDNALSGTSFIAPNKNASVESFEGDLKDGKSMLLSPDDRFLVLKPTYPSQARAERLNRDALTTLMQKTNGQEIPSLEDLAAYAMEAPDPLEGGFSQMYLTLFVPGANQQSVSELTSWNMLRLYGHLSPDARANLRAGGRLPISSLNVAQRACLEKMVYGTGAQLTIEDPKKKGESQPYWMNLITGNGDADYRDEPTEILPNGLPGEGYVDMGLATESFASPEIKDGSKNIASMQILGPDELAIFKMFREDKAYAQISNLLPKFGPLRIGTRSLYKFVFHLNSLISIHQTLKDHHLPKDAPVVAETALPDDFQKQIDEKLAMFKKSPLGALGALMGGARGAIRP